MIAGVLLVWVGIALALTLSAGLLRVVLARLPGQALSPVAHLLGRVEFLWPGLVTAATATVGLYVVVRTGTVLIDHYRATAR